MNKKVDLTVSAKDILSWEISVSSEGVVINDSILINEENPLAIYLDEGVLGKFNPPLLIVDSEGESVANIYQKLIQQQWKLREIDKNKDKYSSKLNLAA